MRLQTKIQLFTSIFMLLLILLVNTSIYLLFHKISSNTELDWLAQSTEDLVDVLHQNPKIPRDELLKAYLPTHGMIRIINDNGKKIIERVKSVENRSLPYEFSNQEQRFITKDASKNTVAVVARPVIWNDGRVVTIQVSQQLKALEANQTTLFFVLAVASLAILIPILIAARVMSKFLLRPIKQLIYAMKENIESKNWKKIEVKNQSKDELYEMGQTYNQMIDNLEVNFEKQEIFVSDASHELKTPISIVKSYAQLLKRRGAENPDVWKEAVAAIDSEADRMQHLVDKMLQLAKSQTETNTETVALSKLVQDVYRTFSGAYKDRKVSCDINGNAADLTVIGSRHQLQQVIYILMDNALKYTEDAIELTLSSEGNQAILQVRDYGEGIASQDLEHIFDRFYRVDKSRTRKSGGTGLGLSIAKQIAQGHGGKLLVDSVIGSGTVFTLQLPLAKETAPEKH